MGAAMWLLLADGEDLYNRNLTLVFAFSGIILSLQEHE